jgi:hypothetical protein
LGPTQALVAALSLLAFPALAALPSPADFSAAATQATQALSGQVAGLNYSGLPFAGYDDKSGWLYGGAFFVYRDAHPEVNAAFYGVTNGNNFHSVTVNIEQRTRTRFLYTFHGLSERAFDYYYGEGDLSPPDNPRVISIVHFEARPALLYTLRPHLHFGIFDDYRDRIETGVERLNTPVPGDPSRLFPDESSDSFGLHADWDTRDSILSSRRGDFVQLDGSFQSPSWTTLPDATGFGQLQLDARHFDPLLGNLILASRFVGAATFGGEPGYLFRYRLGGLDELRGYKDNRFRGKNFAVIQEELRWFLKKWLSLNLSADLGDIGDDAFRQLKVSGIAGLRVGLPPDFGQKVRVDLGYGFDQQTFQIQFGEIF